jgi:3-deoxy-7-phosphoheptulonate synthase/chorismate mutase
MDKKIKKIEHGSPDTFKTIEEQFASLKKGLHIIAGPCSVENEQIMDTTAKRLSELGVEFLRGGAYKPRTSPYDFQGLKEEGLKILNYVGQKYNMLTVSEVVDTKYVETMVKYIDVLQIGSRNMHNFELLKEVGKSKHPVLLKRGMCATIEEFKLAAEYIACEGNTNIIMCERGIRTFETATRNTLDIACAVILKKETKLPVIIDLSHSLGRKDIITEITKAVIALGIDGIMIEVHCRPKDALSDSSQQLTLDEFEKLMEVINTHANRT